MDPQLTRIAATVNLDADTSHTCQTITKQRHRLRLLQGCGTSDMVTCSENRIGTPLVFSANAPSDSKNRCECFRRYGLHKVLMEACCDRPLSIFILPITREREQPQRRVAGDAADSPS